MLFSGKHRSLHLDRTKVLSHALITLEDASCDVQRRGDRLEVRMPGWDARLLEGLPVDLDWMAPLRDHSSMSVQADGSIHYRMRYGTLAQCLQHLFLTLIVMTDVFAGGIIRGSLALLALNCVPLLLAAGSFHFFQRGVFKELQRRLT